MKYLVKIEGITPYMQDRMDDAKLEIWEKKRRHIIERPDINQEDLIKAEFHCYRDEETGKCYIPSEHIHGSLINAGGYLKSKVGIKTKSMKSIVAAIFDITPERIFVKDFDIVDKRSAVNHNIKGRIIKFRPRWNSWGAQFEINIGEDTFSLEILKELLRIAGNYVGIGSYRPACNGKYGRFKLIQLKEIK